MTDRFVAFSALAREFLLERSVDPRDVRTEIQVMPEEQLPPSDGTPPQPSGTPAVEAKAPEAFTILYLGCLREEKGVDAHVRVYEQANWPNSQLVVAGSGPDRPRLERLAGDDETIHFVGHVTDERAYCYEHPDVTVLPTREDAWGLVVNESLYYDTPVVMTAMAGASVLARQNGGVVPELTPAGLIDAIDAVKDAEDGAAPDALKSRLTDPQTMASVILEQIPGAAHDPKVAAWSRR